MLAHAVCILQSATQGTNAWAEPLSYSQNSLDASWKNFVFCMFYNMLLNTSSLRFAWNPKIKVFGWKINSKTMSYHHNVCSYFLSSVFELNSLIQPDQIIFLRHCDELDTIFQSWYLLLSEHYFKPYESRRHIKKYLHLC